MSGCSNCCSSTPKTGLGCLPNTTDISPEDDSADYPNYNQTQHQPPHDSSFSIPSTGSSNCYSKTVSPSAGAVDNSGTQTADASVLTSSQPNVRKSQRIPKTCISCAKKKIKCNKVIPCRPCIERGEAHLCAREVVLVKGLIHNIDATSETNIPQNFLVKMRQLEAENSELLKQVSSLQKLVVQLRHENKANSSKVAQKLTDFSSAAESPESASSMSPFSPSDSSVNNYANALQYLTIGIIEDIDGETNYNEQSPRLKKMNRQSYDENTIPVFSRKPLDKKDIIPSCPSCSIGEMSHCFAARLPFANNSNQKILLSLAFDLPEITRSQSSVIVQYSLECLNFLHNAVHPPSFYLEHEYFWNSNQPKKLSHEFDRVRGQYLWASIWYAILCLGMFYADENLKRKLKMDNKILQVLPHMLFAASLECLHRGELYKYPDIRSVQVFCILGPCFQALSGVNMRNSLLNTMIYISQRLNLDKIDTEENLGLITRNDFGDPDSSTRFLDRELGRRIWWSVIDFDWMDNTGRESIIKPFSFSTILPGNYNDDDLMEYIDETCDQKVQIPTPYSSSFCTISTYHIYMSHLAIIKRKYYFDIDSQRLNLQNLITANKELDKLSASLPTLLKNNSQKFMYGDHNSQALSLQRYLIHIVTDFERLTINRTMAVCVPKAEWNKSCRQVCIDSAKRLLVNCSLDVPLVFKKHPSVSGNGISAAVYLLLDMMDCNVTKRQFNKNLQLIEKLISVLESLQTVHAQARRGISIIRKLITGALIKAEEDAKEKTSNSKKKRQYQQQQQSESAPSLYDIIQRLTILPKISTAPPKSTGITNEFSNKTHDSNNSSSPGNSDDSVDIVMATEGLDPYKSSIRNMTQVSLVGIQQRPHENTLMPVSHADAEIKIEPAASTSPFSIEDFPFSADKGANLYSLQRQQEKEKPRPKFKQRQHEKYHLSQPKQQSQQVATSQKQQQQEPFLQQFQQQLQQPNYTQELQQPQEYQQTQQQQVLYSDQINYFYDPNTSSSVQTENYDVNGQQEPLLYHQEPLPDQQHQKHRFIQELQQQQQQQEQPPLTFPVMNSNEVSYEDLEIMCGLNNQDWDTSIGNFNTDFDFDMSLLQQPPRDCPDDC